MKYFKLIPVFLFSWNCLCAEPNMEGLFKNLPSGDLVGNVSVAKLHIHPSEIDSSKESSEENKYIKMVFTVDENQIDLYQLEYKNGNFNDSEIVKVKHFSNFNKMVLSDSNIERSVYYGLLSMFATNLSKPLVLTLKKIDPEFLLNSNILNEEQIRLYSRQRRHLVTVKSGAVSANAPSPMRPSTDDEKKKVNEILAQDMYKKSENITLTKEDNNFFWHLKLKNVDGLFSNKDFSMQKLKILQKESTYEYSFLNYTSMTAEAILPKKIIYKAPNERVFETQILSFEVATTTKQKLAEKYKAVEEKSGRAKTVSNSMSFGFIY